MVRRFLICLAFATWFFLNTWVQYAESDAIYFARHDPFRAVVLPALCLEIAIALALLAAWEMVRRRRLASQALVHYFFLAASVAPLGIAAVALLRVLPFDPALAIRNRWFWPVAAMMAIAPVFFVVRRPQRASQLLRSAMLYSWPVLLLILIQSARASWLRFPASAYADRESAPRLAGPAPTVRLVWIIFDEMSQTMTFGKRPAGVAMPQFDRLRSESLYAPGAASPADTTEVSIPSLIVGERVTEAGVAGPGDLRIRTASRPSPVSWSSVPNVFDTARARGLNTAVVGWFHPYGRILNRSLSDVYWTAGWLAPGVEEPYRMPALPRLMVNRLRMQFGAMPLLGRFPAFSLLALQREDKAEKTRWMEDRAGELVADPRIGLALIHLPVPHPPSMQAGGRGYLDNLEYADGALGRLRRAMEQAGLWNRTAILVSADHGWRTALWGGGPGWTAAEEAASHQDTSGVPFLLKLPGQTAGAVYSRPFNTIVTRRVIEAVLSGEVSSAQQADALLESTCGAGWRPAAGC